MNEQQLAAWQAARKLQKEKRSPDVLAAAIIAGDRAALSAGITLIESTLASDQANARALIQLILPHTGKSLRLGVTGVPGVGKSTFIEAFGVQLANAGKRLAVLAVDPSSERSGGSILGDKTRMEALSMRQDVFIRPSAAGSTLGGVARKTREAILLCEAAGYDFILIETVGVGQSEIMVHSMVDFFLLLVLAGAGDELQGIKRGIMEMADAIVVTKADGENIKRAQLAQRELKNALHLFPPTPSGWIPEVNIASSIENQNLSTVREMLERYERHSITNGYFKQKRAEQDRYWMHETLQQLLMDGLYGNQILRKLVAEQEKQLISGNVAAFDAAQLIYQTYLEQRSI